MSGSGFSSRACSATSHTSPPPLHPLRFTVSPPQYGQFPSKEEAESVLNSLYHCVYDHYPYDKDVLEVTDKTLNTMKEAYRQIRIAEIYANRIDWMMSGDDSEDTMQDRLKQELNAASPRQSCSA